MKSPEFRRVQQLSRIQEVDVRNAMILLESESHPKIIQLPKDLLKKCRLPLGAGFAQIFGWIFFYLDPWGLRLTITIRYHPPQIKEQRIPPKRKKENYTPVNLTWHWKIVFNRECIFKWSIFHCHVILPEGMGVSKNSGIPKMDGL